MSQRVASLGSALLTVVSLILAGCPKRPDVQVGDGGPLHPESTSAREGREAKVTKPEAITEARVPRPEKKPELAQQPALNDVFFGFDNATLTEDAKKTLGENMTWLKANPHVRVVIEGHADARGTAKYNLALGEQRATVVRDYLLAGGIDAERLLAISRGEEQPFVQGEHESAWKQNRRVHFVMTGGAKATSSSQSSSGVPVVSTPPLTLGP